MSSNYLIDTILQNDEHLFETNNEGNEVLAYAPAMTVSGRNGDNIRVLKWNLTRSDETISSMEVLVNLAQNDLFGKSLVADVQTELESMIGLTKKDVYEALIFNYPEADSSNHLRGKNHKYHGKRWFSHLCIG